MLKLSKITLPHTSLRLNLMVVCEIVLLLFLSLTVLLYFSRQGLKEETFRDAEETLEGTVQHIDNILMSVELTAYNVYQELQGHLDEPDRMADLLSGNYREQSLRHGLCHRLQTLLL